MCIRQVDLVKINASTESQLELARFVRNILCFADQCSVEGVDSKIPIPTSDPGRQRKRRGEFLTRVVGWSQLVLLNSRLVLHWNPRQPAGRHGLAV